LHDLWPFPGLVHYIYIFGTLAPNGTLLAAKFILRPSLVFSYIGSVTARHSSSGRQPNFATWYKEWNYGTFTEGATYIRLGGHHVGHRPTFYTVCHNYRNLYLSGQNLVNMQFICTKMSWPKHEIMLREVLPELSTIYTAFTV